MDQITVRYDESMDSRQLLDYHSRGIQVLCHRCGESLTFVLSRQRAAELRINLGIYCLNHTDHVCTTFNTGPARLDVG